MKEEYYKIENEVTGYMSYYKSLLWLEYYLRSCFGGIWSLKVLDSEKRQINGQEHEIITLAYAYCGYLGKDAYKIELVKS